MSAQRLVPIIQEGAEDGGERGAIYANIRFGGSGTKSRSLLIVRNQQTKRYRTKGENGWVLEAPKSAYGGKRRVAKRLAGRLGGRDT